MAESQGQEKTEQPTGKRKEETREKGQVSKSQELNSLAIFGAGMILVFLVKDMIGNKLSGLAKYVFSNFYTFDLSLGMLKVYAAKALLFYASTLAPIFIGLTLIALAVGFGQAGFRIAPKALAPKFDNLNPIQGIKRKFFSSQPFIELLKSVFKLLIIGGFTYFILSDTIQSSIGLVGFVTSDLITYVLDVAFDFIWKVTLIFAVLAAADFIYQKHKHNKDMMMSKQEVKEERKQTEGDPHVKGKIKSKQMAMARSRMMKEIPTADVVITNPTHFAVALKYKIGSDNAPKVVAKGMDYMAQKIKEIAAKNNVPMHEDVQLARALYKSCEIGDEIPEKLFQAVAQILAYIFQLKKNKKRKSIV
jgi:flagellar biosynthetic protein FlhB